MEELREVFCKVPFGKTNFGDYSDQQSTFTIFSMEPSFRFADLKNKRKKNNFTTLSGIF